MVIYYRFFDKEINKKYELVSGPFAKKIFSIISLQKISY